LLRSFPGTVLFLRQLINGTLEKVNIFYDICFVGLFSFVNRIQNML
jgi:hypothetical protein